MAQTGSSFHGFPPGRISVTPLPNLFFTGLLPQIDSLPELKVTLYLFWRLYRMRGKPIYLAYHELASDKLLLASLRWGERDPLEELKQGLERAIARGSVLHLAIEVGGQVEDSIRVEDIYFLNTAKARDTIARMRSGELQLEEPEGSIRPIRPGQVVLEAPLSERVSASRPDVYTLYEENIGLLTPLIAEELAEAEKEYPIEWLEAAVKEAVVSNRRNWRYIRSILERWQREGRDNGRYEEDRRTYKLGSPYRPKHPGR